MDAVAFMAMFEKLGVFGIAGYLVYNLVQQQRESSAMWHDFAEKISQNMERLVNVLERHSDKK